MKEKLTIPPHSPWLEPDEPVTWNREQVWQRVALAERRRRGPGLLWCWEHVVVLALTLALGWWAWAPSTPAGATPDLAPPALAPPQRPAVAVQADEGVPTPAPSPAPVPGFVPATPPPPPVVVADGHPDHEAPLARTLAPALPLAARTPPLLPLAVRPLPDPPLPPPPRTIVLRAPYLPDLPVYDRPFVARLWRELKRFNAHGQVDWAQLNLLPAEDGSFIFFSGQPARPDSSRVAPHY